MDVVFITIVVVFWLAIVGMAVGCARLAPRRETSSPDMPQGMSTPSSAPLAGAPIAAGRAS